MEKDLSEKIKCKRELDECNFCANFGGAGDDCIECIRGNTLFKHREVTEDEMQELVDKFNKIHLCYGHYVAISNTLKKDYGI